MSFSLIRKGSAFCFCFAFCPVFQEKSNQPFGCWGPCLPLVKKYDWQLLWTPLSHVISTSVETTLIGRDNCVTRCCDGNFFGNNCCPLNKSILTANVVAKSSPAGDGLLSAEIGNVHMFKSLRMEHEVQAFREQIARVQTRLAAVGPTIDHVDFPPPDGLASQKMERNQEGSKI
jgi:hypothetical protein